MGGGPYSGWWRKEGHEMTKREVATLAAPQPGGAYSQGTVGTEPGLYVGGRTPGSGDGPCNG